MLRVLLATAIACVAPVALAAPWGAKPAGHDRVALTGFSLTPPPGDDWFIADQASPADQPTPKAAYGAHFGDNATALAFVYAFALPANVKDPEDILKQLVTRAHRGGPRTHLTSSTSELATVNGARCVRAIAKADDTGVPGHTDEVFQLTKWNLICVHPEYPAFLVDMDYSERMPPGRTSPVPQSVRDGFLQSLMFERLERRVSTIEVQERAAAVAYAANSIWVATGYETGALVRIDPRTNAVVARVNVGVRPSSALGEAGAVWVVNQGSDNVMRVDPATNKVTATVAVGKTPAQIASGFGSLWVTNSGDGTVSRIDPASLGVVAVRGLGEEPIGIVATPGGVFVSDPKGGAIMRIDPATNSVAQTLVRGVRAATVIADGQTLWATELNKGEVFQVSTGEDARILRRIPGALTLPGRMLRSGPDLWVTDSKRDEIVAFDVSASEPKPRRLPAPEWPMGIAEGGGAIWVTSFKGEAVLRLDPTR